MQPKLLYYLHNEDILRRASQWKHNNYITMSTVENVRKTNERFNIIFFFYYSFSCFETIKNYDINFIGAWIITF